MAHASPSATCRSYSEPIRPGRATTEETGGLGCPMASALSTGRTMRKAYKSNPLRDYSRVTAYRLPILSGRSAIRKVDPPKLGDIVVGGQLTYSASYDNNPKLRSTNPKAFPTSRNRSGVNG
jgi:hypothetical protein